jgi:uncharacterized membrane protein YhhN
MALATVKISACGFRLAALATFAPCCFAPITVSLHVAHTAREVGASCFLLAALPFLASGGTTANFVSTTMPALVLAAFVIVIIVVVITRCQQESFSAIITTARGFRLAALAV